MVVRLVRVVRHLVKPLIMYAARFDLYNTCQRRELAGILMLDGKQASTF